MICKNSNKTTGKFIFAAAVLMSMTFMSTSAFAAEKRIPDGITVGDIEAGGMTTLVPGLMLFGSLMVPRATFSS